MEVNILEKLNDVVNNPNKYTEKECSSAFPLLKLYRDPISVLGDDIDYIYNGNSQIPCYNNFILNNDFICLIDFGLQDSHFKEKTTNNVLDKIRAIIDDSITSYENNPIENEKFNIELARKLSTNLLHLLSKNINFVDLFSGIEAIKKDAKEYYLGLIENERYIEGKEQDLCLENHTIHLEEGYDRDYLTSVVLENRFIDIADKLIDENGMSSLMIMNSIDILELGIRIKNGELEEDETYLKYLFALDNGMIFFDIKRAQDLIQKLHIKLNEVNRNKG